MGHLLKNSFFIIIVAAILCVSSARAERIPELRAYTVTSDAIIRQDANWNYVGAASFSQSLSGFNVGSVSFQAVTDLAGNAQFAWSGAPSAWHNGTAQSGNRDIKNPDGSAAAIGNVYDGFFYLTNRNNGDTRTLTLNDLTPGEYYTLQMFGGNYGNDRSSTFTFDRTGAGADTFRYYPAWDSGPNAVTSLRINEENPGAIFTGVANPACYEYTFKAGATSLVMDLKSETGDSWHFYGAALANHPTNPYVDFGKLEASGGKLAITAYTTLHGDMLPDTTWKLEVADSPNGPRRTVTTGDFNISGATSLELLGALYNLDPSFELSGANRDNPAFVSPWTSILPGAGGYAFMNTGYQAAPSHGQWKAIPAQNAETLRDNDHPTGVLRSGEFALTGDAITFDLNGGSGNAGRNLVGLTDADLNTTANGNGFMGVALRNADTGEYVLTKRRTGNNNDWQRLEFTADEIAALMDAGVTNVTLDLIDEFVGGWGWLTVDNFQMLGDIPYFENLCYFLSVGDAPDVAVLGPGLTGNNDVPEPATWVLMLAGAVLVLLRSRGQGSGVRDQ